MIYSRLEDTRKTFAAQRAAKKAAKAEELAARRVALEKKTQARLAAEQTMKIREAQEVEEEERAIKAQADSVAIPAGNLEPVLSPASQRIPRILFLSAEERGKPCLM